MKKLGIGIDIINNTRIKKSITNKKFLSRVFSHAEITNSKKKPSHTLRKHYEHLDPRREPLTKKC